MSSLGLVQLLGLSRVLNTTSNPLDREDRPGQDAGVGGSGSLGMLVLLVLGVLGVNSLYAHFRKIPDLDCVILVILNADQLGAVRAESKLLHIFQMVLQIRELKLPC